MHRVLFRAVALSAILVATMTGVESIVDPTPASAAPVHPDVTFTVFPHDSDDVGFSNSWGYARSGGRRHQGTDIMSPKGTRIVAVAEGVVTKLGKHRRSGYFIRIDHGDGWFTTYMHLNNDTFGTDDGKGGTWTAYFATLMEGDVVQAGQVIGYVGDSGNAEGTPPHTHFEIKLDGKTKNPYPWLKDVWERQQRFASESGIPL